MSLSSLSPSQSLLRASPPAEVEPPREGRPHPSGGYLPGTSRTASPEQTLARARRVFGPLGITRVANVTGLDHVGIPVTMVCRPNARSLSVSQGKGHDLPSARASGVMECIELYHAERITLPLKLASTRELCFSHRLANVQRLPRLSISTYHEQQPLLWIEGLELRSGEPTWLPYELVHQNYTLPFPPGTGCFVLSSNGLASGNHLLEAIHHGLCEVIERDAKALWRVRSEPDRDRGRVALDSVRDPVCRELLDRFAAADVLVGVWDMTSDIGVAAFNCVTVDGRENVFRRVGPAEGMGCHPLRATALRRALTEAAQARLTLIAGSRDDNGRQRYADARDDRLAAETRDRLRRPGHRDFYETPDVLRAGPKEDVAALLEALAAAGMDEVLAVDLTKAEIGIPVARVVVPGLDPYPHVPGYVPGERARRVLEARGWRS